MYINDRTNAVTIANSPEYDFWEIKIVNRIMYESMDVDGLQGKYESLDDDSIATVNCTNLCRRPEVGIDDKKVSIAKSMKKNGKLHFKIPIK